MGPKGKNLFWIPEILDRTLSIRESSYSSLVKTGTRGGLRGRGSPGSKSPGDYGVATQGTYLRDKGVTEEERVDSGDLSLPPSPVFPLAVSYVFLYFRGTECFVSPVWVGVSRTGHGRRPRKGDGRYKKESLLG